MNTAGVGEAGKSVNREGLSFIPTTLEACEVLLKRHNNAVRYRIFKNEQGLLTITPTTLIGEDLSETDHAGFLVFMKNDEYALLENPTVVLCDGELALSTMEKKNTPLH